MNEAPKTETHRPLHVVFGYGQIGPLLVERLLEEGVRVRVVRRSAAPVAPGVELRAGDASDPAFAREAAAGADVVYHCANTAYDSWKTTLTPLTDAILGAARAAGARLVYLDNLYSYGLPAGGTFVAGEAAIAPRDYKGEIRARLLRRLLAEEEVEVAVGHASDFYGPGATNAAVFHDFAWKGLAAGKTVWVGGDPDQPHTYAYAPDVAHGLAALGLHAGEVRGAHFLPARDTGTTRAHLNRLSRALGHGDAKIRRVPAWLFSLLGVFVPLVREIGGMLYQWDGAFVVDSRDFERRFGATPAPLDEAVAASAEWARERFTPAAPRRDRPTRQTAPAR